MVRGNIKYLIGSLNKEDLNNDSLKCTGRVKSALQDAYKVTPLVIAMIYEDRLKSIRVGEESTLKMYHTAVEVEVRGNTYIADLFLRDKVVTEEEYIKIMRSANGYQPVNVYRGEQALDTVSDINLGLKSPKDLNLVDSIIW